jgi:hypothetical protein
MLSIGSQNKKMLLGEEYQEKSLTLTSGPQVFRRKYMLKLRNRLVNGAFKMKLSLWRVLLKFLIGSGG